MPVTVVGTDKYSDIILDLLVKKGADISNIIKASAYQIPVKTRILAGSVHTVKQQIVRIDHYQTKPLAENIEKISSDILTGVGKVNDTFMIFFKNSVDKLDLEIAQIK